MVEPLEFDPEVIVGDIYANPEPLAALVWAIAGSIEENYPTMEVTAEMIGEVLGIMARDAVRKPPTGGYKGFLDEWESKGS
jgi:hypothetical protein